MKTLDEIAIEHGTDKATKHPVGAHGYAPHYDRAFTVIREAPLKVLEIGVGGGESIRTWLDYFSSARVFGVDIVHDTNPWNTVKSGVHERYTFVTGDQSSDTFWACFLADNGKDWDVIVDDGGHFSGQVITTFKALWPAVKSGGLYCIEDLAVCYGAGSVFLTPGFPNHMQFVKEKLDEINQGTEIRSLWFSKELAIFTKA